MREKGAGSLLDRASPTVLFGAGLRLGALFFARHGIRALFGRQVQDDFGYRSFDGFQRIGQHRRAYLIGLLEKTTAYQNSSAD